MIWPDLVFPPINLWNAPKVRVRPARRVARKTTRRPQQRLQTQQRIRALLALR